MREFAGTRSRRSTPNLPRSSVGTRERPLSPTPTFSVGKPNFDIRHLDAVPDRRIGYHLRKAAEARHSSTADTVGMNDTLAVARIDVIHTLTPGWKQLVMVCQACEKRRKAPKKFGANNVAHALSLALRSEHHPKTRIVRTTCMGLYPKRAVAVAAASPNGTVHVIAWHKSDDANAALRALLDAAVASDPSSSNQQEQQ